MLDSVKRMARAVLWAARQMEKQRESDDRRQRAAAAFPPTHSSKVTEEALEWERNLPPHHPWHRAKNEPAPPGVISMGGAMFVLTDAAPVNPELAGLQPGPMPARYRAPESEEQWADRVFEERFGPKV